MALVKDLVQGTPEWLEFRKTKISGTDASIIMGTNPYKSPLKLWKQKMGLEDNDPVNYAMQRGSDLEPRARIAFEELTNLKMDPAIVVHDVYTWMAASLDGYDGKHLLEIKCPMHRVLEDCRNGKYPEYWHTQIQHQLAVTGLEWAYLFIFDGLEGFIIEVEREPQTITEMIGLEEEFYRRMQEFDPPENKYRNRSDMEWHVQAERTVQARLEYERAKKSFEKERALLVELASSENVEGFGVRVNHTYSKGTINYKLVPELKGVDLDKYRGKGTEKITVTFGIQS